LLCNYRAAHFIWKQKKYKRGAAETVCVYEKPAPFVWLFTAPVVARALLAPAFFLL